MPSNMVMEPRKHVPIQWPEHIGLVSTDTLRKAPICRSCEKPMRGHAKGTCSVDTKPQFLSAPAPAKMERDTAPPTATSISCTGAVVQLVQDNAPVPLNRPPQEASRPFSIPPDGRRINPYGRQWVPPTPFSRHSGSDMTPTVIIDATRPRSSSIVPSESDASTTPMDATAYQYLKVQRDLYERFGPPQLQLRALHDLPSAMSAHQASNNVESSCVLYSRSLSQNTSDVPLLNASYWVMTSSDARNLPSILQRLSDYPVTPPSKPQDTVDPPLATRTSPFASLAASNHQLFALAYVLLGAGIFYAYQVAFS